MDTTVRAVDALITHEQSDDSIDTFAECPSCERVVDRSDPVRPPRRECSRLALPRVTITVRLQS
ncbi:MAG: hypothetical protein ACQET5_08020 [Halobacteriota archaeon]